MALYHFDTWSNETLVTDDTGIEFVSFDQAKSEATVALAELAREVLPGSATHTLAVVVRNATGPVLRATEL